MTAKHPPYICTELSSGRVSIRLIKPAGRLRAFGWLLLALSVALVIIAVTSPPQLFSWLASDFRLFGQTLKWLGANSRRFDLTHVILFGWVALLLSCMRSSDPWWQTALPLVGLALATECFQFLVPGRTPQVSDLYDDVFGIMNGVILAIPLSWIARRGKEQRRP